jgi:hypothetical protein
MTPAVHLTAILALLSFSADAAPTVSQTAPVSATPKLNIDPCRTIAADGSATLGPEEDRETLVSSGIAYDSPGRTCKRFVADYKVLPDANPADGHGTLEFKKFGDFNVTVSQGNCEASVLWITTYEKAVGQTSFAQRSSAKYQGKWSGGGGLGFAGCSMAKVSGTDAGGDQPNPAGTEIWRVAVRGTMFGTPVPVKSMLEFVVVPF